MYYLYTIGLCLSIATLVPLFLVRGIRANKYLHSFRQRLAMTLPCLPHDRPIIWIHAVSVGEVLAAQPLIQALLSHLSNYQIVLSTTTETGQLIASRRLPLSGIQRFYFPLDVPYVIRRILNTVKPTLVLIMETEIWPNFLRLCSHKNIPVLLVNGRISERSFRRYKLIKSFFRSVLNHFHLLLMQSQQDAARALALGAQSQKVIITGNLKYDVFPPSEPPDLASIAKQLQPSDHDIIIAGSTVTGEEPIILEAFTQLIRKRISTNSHQHPKKLRLILAPRHPERWAEVEHLLKASGLHYIRRSALPCPELSPAHVILLDSMGELAFLYSLARIAFVGGSLVPAGGHNILEPALFGKPIVVGPYMANFQQITAAFLEAGALIQLRHDPQRTFAEQLLDTFESLLENEPQSKAMGQTAKQLIEQHRGATAKTLAHIKSLLEQRASEPTLPSC